MFELHVDGHETIPAAGGEFLQVRDRPELLFDRLGQEGFDVLSTGAAPGNFNEYEGEVVRRVQLCGHHPDSPQAGE